jgi:hypothetical protein
LEAASAAVSWQQPCQQGEWAEAHSWAVCNPARDQVEACAGEWARVVWLGARGVVRRIEWEPLQGADNCAAVLASNLS